MPKPAIATAVPDPEDIVSFSSLIETMEGGTFDRDLSSAFVAIITRMGRQYQRSGGKPSGRISLVLDFSLLDGVVQISHSFKTEPVEVRTDSFFPRTGGGLTQKSPHIQDALSLAPAPAKTPRGRVRVR